VSVRGPERSGQPKAEGEPQRPLWKKPSFWIITFVVLGVIGSFGDEERPATNAPSITQDETGTADASEETENSEPSQPASPKTELTALMEQAFSGTTNMDKIKLRDVDVIKQIGGGWGVFVEFNADDNLTSGLIKAGIEADMQESYESLYTSDHKVKQASMGAFYPLIDRYGNEEQGLIYKTVLRRKVAEKINWANAHFLQWDSLWDVTFQNVEFSK
jgi:hypothetical protein